MWIKHYCFWYYCTIRNACSSCSYENYSFSVVNTETCWTLHSWQYQNIVFYVLWCQYFWYDLSTELMFNYLSENFCILCFSLVEWIFNWNNWDILTTLILMCLVIFQFDDKTFGFAVWKLIKTSGKVSRKNLWCGLDFREREIVDGKLGLPL